MLSACDCGTGSPDETPPSRLAIDCYFIIICSDIILPDFCIVDMRPSGMTIIIMPPLDREQVSILCMRFCQWLGGCIILWAFPFAFVLDAFPATHSENGTKIQKAKLRERASNMLKAL